MPNILYTLYFNGTANRQPAAFAFPESSAAECPIEDYEPNKKSVVSSFYARYGEGVIKTAERFNLEPESALAVFLTEAGEGAYDASTGRVIIRVEATPPIINSSSRFKGGGNEFQKKYSRHLNIPTSKQTMAQRQDTEWRALFDWFAKEGARATDRTSYGLAQIMGFNFALTGCKNSIEVLYKAQESVYNQIEMFFLFCKNKRINGDSLLGHIKNKNWRSFVRGYNGTGQVEKYLEWLTDNYESVLKL